MLRLVARKLRSAPPQPLPALFWAAGLSFSRAQLIHEVRTQPCHPLWHACSSELARPCRAGRLHRANSCYWTLGCPRAQAPYSKDLAGLFFGEEPLQLWRMWRRGWRTFAPSSSTVFHLWSRTHRPTFQRELDPAARKRSQQRVWRVLAGAEEDAAPQADGPPGSSSSTIQDFWRHCGVVFHDTGGGEVSDRARRGGLPAEAFLTPLKS